MTTGFVYHPDYLKHDTGSHPEQKERLLSIMSLLESSQAIKNLTPIKPRLATLEEIQLIHSNSYIKEVKAKSNQAGWLALDTPLSKESYRVALLSSGGALEAGDRVAKGGVTNAFVLGRPPGHHAERDRGAGFCVFNNISILAKYLQQVYGIKRIAIVDWDVHHGNGTEHAFYEDPSVLYFSTHQFPLYPGTGKAEEVGIGEGVGHTLNVPLSPKTSNSGFIYALDELLLPIADQFKPEFVLVSAGFDAHYADPIAEMEMTAEGFAQYAERVKQIAEKFSKGRVIALLEGGYDLKALAYSVLAVFNIFAELGLEIKDPYPLSRDKLSKGIKERIQAIKALHSKYWKID